MPKTGATGGSPASANHPNAQRDRQAHAADLWAALSPAQQDRIIDRTQKLAKTRGWDPPHDMTNFRFQVAVYSYVEQQHKIRA